MRSSSGFALAATIAALAAAVAAGCGPTGDGSGFDGSGARDGAGGSDDAGGDGVGGFGDSTTGRDGGCIPPDMLVVLDHTLSMSRTPSGQRVTNDPAGHAQTKWVMACDAVKKVSVPPNDQGTRFGLELLPLDPQTADAGAAQGTCVTLSQLLGGTIATNTRCQPGEVLVPPALGTGAAIASLLDPETLRLCISTPIAAAMATATDELKSIADGTRKQYVLLVTDGGETCKGDVVGVTQKLAAAGVETFVVGFGDTDGGAGGVNVSLLNDVACAGMTAQNFSTSCTKNGGGYVAVNPSGSPLYYAAQDANSLDAALQAIAGGVCCSCTH